MEKQLHLAIEALFRNQPDIFGFTDQTHQTEWNLAHHLANEIQSLFPDLQCDVELIKPNYENRRPDIIVHRRGSQDHNLLVVEVKLDGTDDALQHDAEKIAQYWFQPPLRYEYGAIVDLRRDGRYSVRILRAAVSFPVK